MITIRLFLRTLEHLLETTTIYLRAFLETPHEVVNDILAHRPRNGSHLLPVGFLEVSECTGFLEYKRFEICTPWGDLPKWSRGWPKK